MAGRGGASSFAGGAAWAGFSGIVSIVVPFGVFILFAKVLPPEDIGRFALAVVICELVKSFGMPGLYEAMLARQEDAEATQPAALGVLLLAGLLLLPVHAGLMAGIWTLSGGWPPDDQVWLTLIIGLKVPVDLLLMQPQTELARRKAYGRLAQRNLMATLAASALSVVLLGLGLPGIGWIAFTLGSSVAMVLGSVIGTGALCRPAWDLARLRPLWPEATRASAVRFAVAANSHLDQLFLGAMLGPLAFSFYNFGKRIEAAFINVTNTFAGTLFQPYFVGTPPEGRSEALRKSFLLLLSTVGVATATFVAAGDLVIAAVLGPTWLPAVPVAIIMAFGAQVRAFGAAIGCMLSVTGRNGTMLRYFLVTTLSGILVVTATAHLGLAVITAALLLRMILSVAYLMHAARKDAGPRPLRLYLLGGYLPFLAMCGAAIAGRALVTGSVWDAGEASIALTGIACLAAAAPAAAIGLGLLMREKRSFRLLPLTQVAGGS